MTDEIIRVMPIYVEGDRHYLSSASWDKSRILLTKDIKLAATFPKNFESSGLRNFKKVTRVTLLSSGEESDVAVSILNNGEYLCWSEGSSLPALISTNDINKAWVYDAECPPSVPTFVASLKVDVETYYEIVEDN